VFVGVTGAESNSLQKKKKKERASFVSFKVEFVFGFLKRRKEKEEENMAAINVTNVVVLDNPAPFTNPLQFEIEYECLYDLKDDLEWKLIYVGSADSDKHDQVLDSVLVGPVYAGGYRFVFQANPPDVSRLPTEDIVGVTVVFLSCSYKGEEFIRVGYYVNNEYTDEELQENPPSQPQIEKLSRNILADKPRVTKWSIGFDSEAVQPSYNNDMAYTASQKRDELLNAMVIDEQIV